MALPWMGIEKVESILPWMNIEKVEVGPWMAEVGLPSRLMR